MNGTEDLDTVDRATLRVWRVINILGWSFVALVIGYFGNWVAMNAASATANLFGGVWPAPPLMAVLYAALVGAVIGSIIGLRVYRSPAAAAGVVAFLAGGLFPQVTILFGSFLVGSVLTGVAEVGAAMAVAQAVWSRRPAALRAR